MVYKIIALTEHSAFDLLVTIRSKGGKAVKLENSRCVLTDYVFDESCHLVATTEECNRWDLEKWNGA